MNRMWISAVVVWAVMVTAADGQEPGQVGRRLYLSAAAADISTTAVLFAANRYAYEGNPLYGWVMDPRAIAEGRRASVGQVTAVLAMSAAVDVASTWAVRRWLEPRHRRVAAVLYCVGAGVRGRQAVLNLRRARPD